MGTEKDSNCKGIGKVRLMFFIKTGCELHVMFIKYPF